MQLLADKEEILKENNETKQRIEELEIQIEDLTNRNIDLETKNKEEKQKIINLTIMNSEILQKLQYHEHANFTEFTKNVNNYFTSFATGLLSYFINNYYLNILKNIQQIRNLPYIDKIFKVIDLILIL